ncbi:CRISPR-associated protein Cas2 [Nocardiopsis mwathae]|uniref:CRISPR-associated endoribonuclease Cas2 n=1 Tax=Nocardiopsis mwathae TaxID=1472723 RepID=A0A7W9YMK7_9ACTN|nr:CRISPR-associated protein Cas2 [Nocardiopsis mwathae]
MHIIVVYDTAAERNPKILRTCRRYLHHVQRSVFEGQLSPAQFTRFQRDVKDLIDDEYDHVIAYTLPPGAVPQRVTWGQERDAPSDIL